MPSSSQFKLTKCAILILVTIAISACATEPKWIQEPPANAVSACAPEGSGDWQAAELRAKTQFAGSVTLTQRYFSQRQSIQNGDQSEMHFKRINHTTQQQLGIVPVIEEIARWEGKLGVIRQKCILIRSVTQ